MFSCARVLQSSIGGAAADVEQVFGLADVRGVGGDAPDLEKMFGLDDDNPVNPGAAGFVVPEGIRVKSPAWFQLIAKRRWDQCAKPPTPISSGYTALADAWDLGTLRAGDLAARPECGETQAAHSNTFTLDNLIRFAFKEIGCGHSAVQGEVAINGTRRRLEGLSTVSSLAQLALERSSKKMFSLLNGIAPEGLVFCRSSDATPLLVKFGRMQGTLASSARYPKYVENAEEDGYGYWTTIPFEQWARENPGLAPPGFGVVEFLGATGEVHWGRFGATQESFQRKRHEFLFPPWITQRANSSVMFSALERLSGPFNLEGLIALSREMDTKSSGIMIVSDMMDNCRTTKRCLRAVAHKLKDTSILYPSTLGCESHVLHNGIVASVREDQVVGHTHAFAMVLQVHGRRQQLLAAAEELIRRELLIHTGEPSADAASHLEIVIQNTIQRRDRVVRGCISPETSGESDMKRKATAQALPGLKKMVNGNILLPRCSHVCNGWHGSFMEVYGM
jgi:hypothetical protein